ncbi:hypothetical protein OIV83_004082 [Microbotryomycetes sp. JL201]|nr:hypothetical protein OIV83_004082 [Microbotryomycetes sp. JL201]
MTAQTTQRTQTTPADQQKAIMNQMSASTMHKPGFADEAGQDFASFLDLSFTESAASLPLPTPTLFSATTALVPSSQAPTSAAQPAVFANAFSRHDDGTLDSPLGLSPASLGGSSSASPFDFAHGDFNSPMMSSVYGTPDLFSESLATPSAEFPSLFGAAPAFKSAITSATVSAPVLAPTMIAVSPSLMSLDGDDLSGPPTPAFAEESLAQTDVKPVRASSRKPKVNVSRLGKTDDELALEDAMSRLPVKDKFTGTRNTKIKPIPLDAPTVQKNYAIPSATSRKRAPSVVASKLVAGASAGGKGNKRARRDSTPASPALAALPDLQSAPDGSINPDDLPEEVLTAIELKRRQNTLAARRSRMRKAEHLSDLKAAIEERDQRIAALEEELLALRRKLGE